MPPRADGLELRLPEAGDVDALVALRSDPLVREQLIGFTFGTTREGTLRWVERMSSGEGPDVAYMAIDPAGALIGFGGLYEIDHRNGSCEVGLAVAPAHWGQGHGSRIIAALTAYAHRELRLKRVQAVIAGGNERSLRAFERCGYRHEGRMRDALYRGGTHHDVVVMSRLDADADADGTPMTDQMAYWTEYYEQVLSAPSPWLDYSNDQVQAQTLALALEAAGPIRTKDCLDFGCGRGQLARELRALGAARVVGVDVMEPLLAENRAVEPEIEWVLSTEREEHLRSDYDVMFFVEVLQLVPSLDILDRHWSRLRPGGRMVGLLSNAECPIASAVAERFEGRYKLRHFDELTAVAAGLDGLERAAIRGLSFQDDQLLTPYAVSEWHTDRWPSSEPPNRWQFVFVKARGPA
jgi:RimJ/RimL family protein N-acetyltransferase/2-polyprenyl-3-methyl-5-hydroxy-6-metoxy-1,4-benzoquinol methylase